jgi:hypothetical protein
MVGETASESAGRVDQKDRNDLDYAVNSAAPALGGDLSSSDGPHRRSQRQQPKPAKKAPMP